MSRKARLEVKKEQLATQQSVKQEMSKHESAMNDYLLVHQTEISKRINNHIILAGKEHLETLSREMKIYYGKFRDAIAQKHKYEVEIASGMISSKNNGGALLTVEELKVEILVQDVQINAAIVDMRRKIMTQLLTMMDFDTITAEIVDKYIASVEDAIAKYGYKLFPEDYTPIPIDG